MPEDEEREAGREVTRYDGKVIYMHWAVVLVFIPLLIIALLLLRDWFWETFTIVGTDPIIPTPSWGEDLHLMLALLLLVLGLVHVLLHIKQEKRPILPTDVMADFQASVHTLKYVFFLSRWDERSGVAKYRGNQRMSYIITFYVIALAAITGMIAAWGGWEDSGTTIHVVSGSLVVLVFIYRMIYTIRKREWIAWRSIFITGRMPIWYVKQTHPKWYEEMEPTKAGADGPSAKGEPPSEPEPPTGPVETKEPEAQREPEAPEAKVGPTA